MKELFIAGHEELINEFLSAHPEADWSEAYEAVGPAVYRLYQNRRADMVDAAKERES